MRILLTTNPGIEDITAAEAEAHLRGSRIVETRPLHGRVIVEVPGSNLDAIWRKLQPLKSVHRASILLARGRIGRDHGSLDVLRRAVEGAGLEEYMTPHTSYAVRAYRYGDHKYTSIDIARVVGDAVGRYVEKRYGSRPVVFLNAPNVVIGAHVVFDEYFITLELSGDISAHRRGYRIYDHPAALKPTIAYAMLVLSGASDGEAIVDPMCGGGTIAVEAGMLFEDADIVCSDRNPLHIKGARLNAAAARLDKRIRFLVGDARRLDELLGRESMDRIVSNPPYGIRMGSPKAIRMLYRDFIASAAKTLRPGGTITIITPEHRHARAYMEKVGLTLVHERTVAHGDLWVKILVARREA